MQLSSSRLFPPIIPGQNPTCLIFDFSFFLIANKLKKNSVGCVQTRHAAHRDTMIFGCATARLSGCLNIDHKHRAPRRSCLFVVVDIIYIKRKMGICLYSVFIRSSSSETRACRSRVGWGALSKFRQYMRIICTYLSGLVRESKYMEEGCVL